MAAWGTAWGEAWGGAWGLAAEAPAPAPPQTSVRGGSKNKRPRYWWEAEKQEKEEGRVDELSPLPIAKPDLPRLPEPINLASLARDAIRGKQQSATEPTSVAFESRTAQARLAAIEDDEEAATSAFLMLME